MSTAKGMAGITAAMGSLACVAALAVAWPAHGATPLRSYATEWNREAQGITTAQKEALITAILDQWQPAALRFGADAKTWRDSFGLQLSMLPGSKLAALSATPPEPNIPADLPFITRLFASDRLETIFAALEEDESEWAKTQLDTLRTKSPLSCKVSLRLMAEGANRTSFTDEMRAEYALAGRVVRTHDFREGVRALLIDKDNSPEWEPATPEEVTDEMLSILFEPLPPSEQWTPFPEARE